MNCIDRLNNVEDRKRAIVMILKKNKESELVTDKKNKEIEIRMTNSNKINNSFLL